MSMQCLKIQSLCVFGTKLGKGLMNLVFIPVFKPHAHKLYILRHWTNIVNVYLLLDNPTNQSDHQSTLTSQPQHEDNRGCRVESRRGDC